MTAAIRKWQRVRLYFLALILAAAFLAILLKAFSLQVYEREWLNERAKKELESYLSLGAVRGEIFDIRGEKLATSVAVYSVYADPPVIKDKSAAARRLGDVLGLSFEEVADKLSLDRHFVWLKRRLSQEEAQAVRALGIGGVGLSQEYVRAYPNQDLAAHFLGFVGDDGQGLEGLELAMDDSLAAGQARIKVKRDNLGRKMVDSPDSGLDQHRGGSIVLTLDMRIQYLVEKALAKAVIEKNAQSGMALIMRPKTGAVVAAASFPTFDPNKFQDVASPAVRRNRILTDPFEPGSTFKVFVVAAALEEALINPATVIHCENGSFKVANKVIRDTASYGDLTVSEVIKHSSNIGALKIGDILGNELLFNYLTRFSFGEKTGLDHLPGEAAGLLRPPKQWHGVDAANISFGQGLSVTALQMVMAMCSLANDGVLMKPYVVDRVLDSEGHIIEKTEPRIIRQVISPLTARQLAAMLRLAVMKGGTGFRAEVAGYPVAGKTGTAQKVARGGKTYATDKYVASFMGFAPYHDPELCLLVVLDEPQPNYYGGTVAAPIFREIMEEALPLLDVPLAPDRGDPVWPVLNNSVVGAPGVLISGQSTNFIRVKLKKGDREAAGPVVSEEDLIMAEVERQFSPISLRLQAEPGVMPNLAGLTMRQVLDLMSPYQLDLEYLGSGQVTGQDPLPGETVSAGQYGQIIFERP